MRYLVRAMVCPGVVRKAAKLVPTVLQALAFVVCDFCDVMTETNDS